MCLRCLSWWETGDIPSLGHSGNLCGSQPQNTTAFELPILSSQATPLWTFNNKQSHRQHLDKNSSAACGSALYFQAPQLQMINCQEQSSFCWDKVFERCGLSHGTVCLSHPALPGRSHSTPCCPTHSHLQDSARHPDSNTAGLSAWINDDCSCHQKLHQLCAEGRDCITALPFCLRRRRDEQLPRAENPAFCRVMSDSRSHCNQTQESHPGTAL